MIDAGRGMLYDALKSVEAKWDNAETYWQDSTRQQFVEGILEPLRVHVAATLEGIDQLQVVLSRMRHDCEGVNYDIYQGD